MWIRIFALMEKEFHVIWRDKRARFALILPPLIQLLIFVFAITLDVSQTTIGIIDHDDGPLGFELKQRLQGSPIFQNIVPLANHQEAKNFINKQKGLLVLSIDEDFSRNVLSNKTASLQLILDGKKSNSAQIVTGYLNDILKSFLKETSPMNTLPEPITRNWFNPNLIYRWYTVPSITGLLIMLISLVVTSMSVARERELGTFEQLLVSPLNNGEILLGKALPALLIALVEGTFIVIIGCFLYQIPFQGSILLLWLSMAIFISSIVGIGLFISSLCSTQQQAFLGTFTFMSPAVTLSGFATPIENMPQWLQYVTYAIPLRYYLFIAKGIFLKNINFWQILPSLAAMGFIATITLSLAAFLFHRRIQ